MGWWTGLGWATPGGGQARIRSHRPVEGLGGWGRQVIGRTASAMRQPVDRVRPHPDLKGVAGKCWTSVAPFPRLGQTGWHPSLPHGTRTQPAGSISSTGVSPHDRVRAIQPTSSLPAGYALPIWAVTAGSHEKLVASCLTIWCLVALLGCGYGESAFF